MKDFYYQTFCISLKDKTLLVADVIFSGEKPSEEFWSLGNPALIMDKNGSITLEPYEFEALDDDICLLSENEIYSYSEPTDEILEQYNMFQYLIHVEALVA